MRARLLLVPAILALPLLCSAQVSAPMAARRAELRRAARACDMRSGMILMTVVDSAGAPVEGVRMTLRRDGVAAPLHEDSTGHGGQVTLAEDGDLGRIPAKRNRYSVTLRKGGKTQRVKVQLGADAAGCHIALLSGPTVVTF